MASGSTSILTMLILPIHEHGISFHLFVSSLISSIDVLLFSVYRSFASLVKPIHNYFIVFDVIVNGIAFFTSISDNSLLVYKNATDFCILIFYPATLINLFISSKSFLVESLGFSVHKIILSENNNNFTSSFPMRISFISFSCLIALSGTSSTILNKSSENGHPYFVQDFRGKVFNLSPLSMILALGLSYMAFIILRYILSIPN